MLIIVVTMYTNLFIFLRRPDRITTPTSSQVDEVNVRSTTSSVDGGYKWWTRKKLGTDIAGEDEGIPPNRRRSTYVPAPKATSPTRPDLPRRSTTEKGAPWENLDLQVPDVSFSAYVDPRPTVGRRVSIVNLATPESTTPHQSSRRGSAVAFGAPLAPLSLDIPLSLLTPPTPTLPSENYIAFPPASPASPNTSLAAPVSPFGQPQPQTHASPSSQTPLISLPRRPSSPHRPSEDSTISEHGRRHDENDDDHDSYNDSSSDVDSLSPPEKLASRRSSRQDSHMGSRKQSNTLSLKEILEQTGPPPPTPGSMPMSPGGSTWGIAGGKQEADLSKSASGTGTGTGSSSDGWTSQESMNAYLNRKASMLMILFPLAVSRPQSPNLYHISSTVTDPVPHRLYSFSSRSTSPSSRSPSFGSSVTLSSQTQ